ncbi:PKD domain-containing protein [Paraflavitalea speifideaquila]|uniref:PKD domain-containing protein n=1 Tax=Paraflavitalea speifideaquila TaxID=3076558 RepID=UPI0028E9E881|nr:PKD domain-containing protein [Paraflavitalea speifideiaquila]
MNLPPSTCRAPFAVNFTDLTSGPGTLTYQWNFGNSTGSTLQSPTATYGTTGTYTVTLNVTSEYGCTGNIQKTVPVNGTGTSFTSPDTVCVHNTVSFQNVSTTTPVSTTWDFGNGLQSTTLNGSSTYDLAGNYTIKLTNVYDQCLDSFSRRLVVVDKPVVNFTSLATTACKAPLTVNLQDASPDATSWQWNFGDGNTSTLQNPSHQYNAEGSYDVTLTITSRQGCTNSLTQPAFVRIIKPTVAFGNAPTGGCAATFTFTPTANVNAIDGVLTYFWEYGDGFIATTTTPTGPTHAYPTPGNYTIKLTITTRGGCTESVQLIDGIKVGTLPVANFSVAPTDACASDAINFTDLSTPTTPPGAVDEWLWNFGDGSTSNQRHPTHIYADSGFYNVTLTAYNNKCPATSAVQQIHIKPPIASFDYQVACPNGLQVNFTDRSKVNTAVYGPVTYTWDFGDGSPVSNAVTPPPHTYPGIGAYTVTLTVASPNPGGCSNTFAQAIRLVGEKADFSISTPTVCTDAYVTLAAINNTPANIQQYEWLLDGVPVSLGLATIYLKFPTTGTHSITLRITDINGCTDAKTVTGAITVTGPTANFRPVQQGGCTNTTVNFNDLSTSTVGIKSWTFDFGDGHTQTYTAGPFTHTYTDTGRFVPKLTVTDNLDCTNTYTSTDTVFITKPVAGFKNDFNTICPNTDLPFRDTSSGKGLSWQWDFGDGNGSNVQSPIHRYTATSGTYSVKLVITDAMGCKDSVTKANLITIKKPRPAFTIQDTSSICPLLETKFTFQGSDYESFYWDFGDGSTSTLPKPNHFYNAYGTYEAKLYVIGFGGCIDSTSDTVNVHNPYTASSLTYSPLTNCNSLLVDFSLVTPLPQNSPSIMVMAARTIRRVKYSSIFINHPGFMPLHPTTGQRWLPGFSRRPQYHPGNWRLAFIWRRQKIFCDQGTVNFTNYTVGNDPVVTRTWDFGDGTTSTDTDPIHQFTQPGTFVVKHIVTTQSGCDNTVTDTIRVYGTPHPVIVSDTAVCINAVLQLQGSLTVPDTAITWKWDLGSNGQSTTQNASVKYPQTGTYTVSLEATNKLGCKDKTTKNIYVPPTPAVSLNGNATIPVGTGITIPVTYSPNVVSYTWSPPTGLSCTDCPTPFANPKFTTLYNVRAEDIYGCSATQGITVTVICNSENYFVPNTFTPNGDGQNDVFMPRGRSIDRITRMQIFNRWESWYMKKEFYGQ